MKKSLIAMVILSISSLLFAEETFEEKKQKWSKKPVHQSVAPDFIQVVDVKAAWEAERPAVSLISGQDMVEMPSGVFGSKGALLDIKNDPRRHWFGLLAKQSWVSFDLGKDFKVYEIRIWNYQQNRRYGLNRRGMKQIKIEYATSEAPDNWKLLKEVSLKPADDKNSSAPEVIAVDLSKMRYIRITPDSEVGKGNHNTSDKTDKNVAGLGQVRFYGKAVK